MPRWSGRPAPPCADTGALKALTWTGIGLLAASVPAPIGPSLGAPTSVRKPPVEVRRGPDRGCALILSKARAVCGSLGHSVCVYVDSSGFSPSSPQLGLHPAHACVQSPIHSRAPSAPESPDYLRCAGDIAGCPVSARAASPLQQAASSSARSSSSMATGVGSPAASWGRRGVATRRVSVQCWRAVDRRRREARSRAEAGVMGQTCTGAHNHSGHRT